MADESQRKSQAGGENTGLDLDVPGAEGRGASKMTLEQLLEEHPEADGLGHLSLPTDEAASPASSTEDREVARSSPAASRRKG